MPDVDQYGQGIGIWQMTDAPSIPDAVKLLAAGVIPRGVMRFASASARSATLVGAQAPVDGMLTWLDDVKRLELRSEGAWVVVSVGTRAWTTVPLASGWAHNGNSQGTFQYRIVNFAGEDSIMLRGGISRDSYPSTIPGSFTLNTTTLPASARPSTLRTIVVPCSDVSSDRITMKLDITPAGQLILYGITSTAKPPWIGFNGCFASL
ncbi:hypothetical protein TU94_28475 [Streptomyces cyaneogriseus subsp. noncyanogenus]|uniref:Uncharacterized protein n=1 Tax=Streptomyces cyaneogriseus subsp. noncyanogenus TaxID=477245 RepID=A0A0C5FXI4_9ACTN|nr:hypothetical protein [Streptomyces cyaneogriseus]AJP04797.1 hypothetical protein TU94_28475 [Streptomyces cyaneogriseus subsp. noncyanogenus]